MLETLISSKTRVKLLLKFFLNSNTTAYLRNLESEFGDSTNAIRVELNRLEKAGMLRSFLNGNKKMFQANVDHPLFNEVHSILRKTIGLDLIIEKVVMRLGDLDAVYLVGDFSKGMDSQIIDILIVGSVDRPYLISLIEKAEDLISRKIRYVIFSKEEALSTMMTEYQPEPLLLWSSTEEG